MELETLNNVELGKYERETTILFNELENEAIVFTASRKVITKCKKMNFEILSENDDGVIFTCPKNCISFRDAKKKKKVLSEEHKKKLLNNNKK